ncbi:MAG: tetratricopeptide repeat protein [Capsulimonadales bacterium]|nr:tetratricopeptide repeat protein [Capsulimonadales bacterium]
MKATETTTPHETSESVDPKADRLADAREYLRLGRERFRTGDIEDAAAYYGISLELFPLAETYTALGVVLAMRGQWEAAIEQCRHAVELAPETGNAYNDIGVYLSELGRREEALVWLDRAIAAPEYDCRHYPYFHRGRLLEQAGRFQEARDAFHQSLRLEPDWEPAQAALRHVLGWLN